MAPLPRLTTTTEYDLMIDFWERPVSNENTALCKCRRDKNYHCRLILFCLHWCHFYYKQLHKTSLPFNIFQSWNEKREKKELKAENSARKTGICVSIQIWWKLMKVGYGCVKLLQWLKFNSIFENRKLYSFIFFWVEHNC